jgi:hypothetical protein
MIEIRNILAAAALSLGLAGCMSDTAKNDSAAPGNDPYGGLTCDQAVARMTAELKAYADVHPAAKRAADSGDTAPRPVRVILPYPPVVGAPIGDSGFSAGENAHDSTTWAEPHGGGVEWIPPVGYTGDTTQPIDSSLQAGDTGLSTTMPARISAVQVVATGAYRAHVRIYDYADRLVNEFQQDFGYRGELTNPYRSVPGGLVSYLVWSGKDTRGDPVKTGVYRWEIALTFDDGTSKTITMKTGYLAPECSGT